LHSRLPRLQMHFLASVIPRDFVGFSPHALALVVYFAPSATHCTPCRLAFLPFSTARGALVFDFLGVPPLFIPNYLYTFIHASTKCTTSNRFRVHYCIPVVPLDHPHVVDYPLMLLRYPLSATLVHTRVSSTPARVSSSSRRWKISMRACV
jgi:hypothetical protein